MKMIHKVFLYIAIMGFLSPLTAFGLTLNPTSVNMSGDYLGTYTLSPETFTLSCSSLDNYVLYKSSDNLIIQAFDMNCTTLANEMAIAPYSTIDMFQWATDEDYPYFGTGNHFLEVTEAQHTYCQGATYSECIAFGVVQDLPYTTTNITYPANINTLSEVTATATSTFALATGIEYEDITNWSGSMIAMVLGSGLGVFSGLMPWIIAIMVFMGIVGLIYRGFRFFRH